MYETMEKVLIGRLIGSAGSVSLWDPGERPGRRRPGDRRRP